MSGIKELYTDGGVILSNPSGHGGTWAWCRIEDGVRVADASGLIRNADFGCRVTNNMAELYAVLMALEVLPSGWTGTLHTDSDVTRRRLWRKSKRSKAIGGFTDALKARLYAAFDASSVQVRLISSHPSEADLERGWTIDGRKVSEWNVFCDRRCRAEADKYLAELPTCKVR